MHKLANWFSLLLFTCALLISCSQPSPDTLVVGTISGPETDLVDVAQQVALEKYGLTVKIVEFNDYNLPNEALRDGSLDANVYQHLPYLQAAIQAHGYDFKVIAKTFIYPTGIYSKRVKSLSQLPNRALIALPNDPSNETRALLLLQKAGLIRLKAKSTALLTNIVYNPKELRFKELDAAQLTRILPDVDAAVINTNFAIPAGLNPGLDSLYSESKQSPYANLIVARANSKKMAQLDLFVKAFHSDEVKHKAQLLFGSGAVPAW